MGKKKILFGICIVILLALAGTGSAFKSGSSGYNCYGSSCHADQWTSSNIAFYNQTHRYNDTVQNPPSCENCHAGAWSSSDRFNFSLRTGTATYLTSTTCENCHKAKYDDWQGTMHRVMLTSNSTAQAMGLPTPSGFSWANMSYVIVGKLELRYLNESGYLVKRYISENQTFADYGPRQYTCGSCHTTGYNPNGNQSGLPGIVGTWSEPGIACERCHGPGGNGHQVEANVSEQVCLQCHNGSTRQGTFLSSAHSPPLEAPTRCLMCHSPFDYARNNTVTSTTAINVVCANCHNSHNTSDDKYRALFSPGGFDQAVYANASDAKNSFFNSTASRLLLTGGPTGMLTAGKDVYDILTTPALIPADIVDESYGGPIEVTGPISEVLCSNCHYEHGLGHVAGVNLTHARLNYPGLGLAPATCTDCHMSGDLKKHSFNVKDEIDFPSNTCSRGTECHVTSDQNLNHSRFSVVPVVNEWNASAHNDKEVGINKSRNYNGYYWNNTAGVPNSQRVSCNKCHSPMDWNPLQDSNTANVPLTADFKGITCAVCHNLHDMGDWLKKTNDTFGKPKAYAWYNKDAIPIINDTTGAITRYKANYSMMANTTELCGNCHSNIRIGNTGPGYGTPSSRNPTGIISPHGFPAKDIFVGSWKQTNDFECIDCHMAKKITDPTNLTEMVLPDSQKVTGHSFKVNVPILQNETKCLDCHVVGDISTRIDVIKADTQTKWNATNITVMDALAQINAFTGPKNQSRDLIAVAYWNLRLVSSDESWGVHDPVKVNNLLNESSTLANDALAALGSEGGKLNITSFSPTTPTVIDVVGGPTRTFSITVNQVANVSWQINETEAANETGVTTSSYPNGSAAEGTWNVTAVAENTNGSVMRNWIWTVSPQVAGYTISGFKINSENNSGVPGWTINLTNATMNVSANTETNGMYQFTGLANGTYTVTEIMQPDWMNVTPTSIDVLIEGVDVMNKNFTNTPTVVSGQTFTISGFKINSANNSGVPGWTINLTNASMNVSATTDTNGMYQFTGLVNGTYTVTEIMQPDWMNVTPTSIDVLIEGVDVMNKNFTNALIPVVTKPTSFLLTPDTSAVLKGTVINIEITALNGSLPVSLFNGTANITIAANNLSTVNAPINVSFVNGNTTIDVTSSVAQFVTVTATNGNITGSTIVEFADMVVDLNMGWNLVSIPSFADPSDINQTLKLVQNNGVQTFNPATRNFTTPTDLQPLYGYWINVTADNQKLGFIADTSVIIEPPTRSLFEGWNLIGVSASRTHPDTLNAGTLFGSLKYGPHFTEQYYSGLVTYDEKPPKTLLAGENDLTDLTDNTPLKQGHGYWLFIKNIPNTNENNVPWAGKLW